MIWRRRSRERSDVGTIPEVVKPRPQPRFTPMVLKRAQAIANKDAGARVEIIRLRRAFDGAGEFVGINVRPAERQLPQLVNITAQ